MLAHINYSLITTFTTTHQYEFSGCTELAITSIPQTGENITILVERLVNTRNIDRNIRVVRMKVLNSLRSSKNTDKLDIPYSPTFQDNDRSHSLTSGGKHWIEDQTDLYGRFDGQFIVVSDRFEGILIPV